MSGDGSFDLSKLESQTTAARIERELRALLPAALYVAQTSGLDRQATAAHLIKVAMVVIRSKLPDESGP